VNYISKKDMITICCYCKKIKNNDGTWKHKIVDSKQLKTHGICPACFEVEMRNIDEIKAKENKKLVV